MIESSTNTIKKIDWLLIDAGTADISVSMLHRFSSLEGCYQKSNLSYNDKGYVQENHTLITFNSADIPLRFS